MRPSTNNRIERQKRRSVAWTRAYGSQERVEWVATQPCIACGVRHCDNAHAISGGVGRKSDAKYIVPACHRCHNELHQHGTKTFEAKYGVNLLDCAADTDRRWREECDR